LFLQGKEVPFEVVKENPFDEGRVKAPVAMQVSDRPRIHALAYMQRNTKTMGLARPLMKLDIFQKHM
jgi:hypothetical protein